MLLSNIDMILAKTDLSIARHYASLAPDQERARAIFGEIEAEHSRAVAALQAITGEAERLADNPSLARSLKLLYALHRAAELPADRADPTLARRRVRMMKSARGF